MDAPTSAESLNKLAEEKRGLLVALPYRIGLWVSQSDSSGGHQADAEEKAALATIIRSYAEDFCKSEFVQSLMMETLAKSDQWDSWSDHLDAVPEECKKALVTIDTHLNPREAQTFRDNLWDIALSVALAHSEYHAVKNGLEKFVFYLFLIKDRLTLKYRRPLSINEDRKISLKERQALRVLSKQLG